MAYLVARKDGRYEIRESISTEAGPRSRTLAAFRELDDDVLDRAHESSRRPFDRAAIEARADELAVPRNTGVASRLARRLIGELRRGRNPAPVLVRCLRDELPAEPRPTPDTVEQAMEWLGRSDLERGETIADLLKLASRLPPRDRPPRSDFPGIRSSR